MTVMMRWPVRILLVLGMIVALGGCRESVDTAALTPTPAVTTTRSAGECAAQSISTALFIGDSYVEGVDGGGQPYPRRVGAEFGWQVDVDAKGGSGFVARGPVASALPFGQRLAADSGDAPDLVVIDGGRNDAIVPVTTMENAIGEYVGAVRAKWPLACVVFVIPSFMTAEPPSFYDDIVNYARTVLVPRYDVHIIDPVALGWYRDRDLSGMLMPDGVHPNAAGNDYITARMTDALRTVTGA
ncbi:SGNH/GDSL hydrolase family protein [Gordonia sp. N1V]|uniref:SGNH/GDSL hydrolase family protein n=1 Tax=Gordonia sp. N1V TaxID=3034163 RepID=UPI0023E1FD4E|nr:SGNH/GDSL hydrolase family protein [Gordonia sp. N1V]MDF3284090.1 SGNH/GDSL hydrolase family protein [Gordonia sp. N1V]